MGIAAEWVTRDNIKELHHNGTVILSGKCGNDDVLIGDNERTVQLLKWTPKISFEQMICDMLEGEPQVLPHPPAADAALRC